MASDCTILHRMKATQERIFRIACRDGLSLKAISLDSGIPYSTLRSYAGHNGDTAEMSVSAVYKLIGVIPDELLSLLLPEGRAIVRAPEAVDHDALCEAVEDYLQAKMAAHRADSPAGPAICPEKEKPELDAKVVTIGALAA